MNTLVPLAPFIRRLQRLAEEMTPEEIGQKLGKTRDWIQDRLLLGKLSDDTLSQYDDCKIGLVQLIAMAKKL